MPKMNRYARVKRKIEIIHTKKKKKEKSKRVANPRIINLYLSVRE